MTALSCCDLWPKVRSSSLRIAKGSCGCLTSVSSRLRSSAWSTCSRRATWFGQSFASSASATSPLIAAAMTHMLIAFVSPGPNLKWRGIPNFRASVWVVFARAILPPRALDRRKDISLKSKRTHAETNSSTMDRGACVSQLMASSMASSMALMRSRTTLALTPSTPAHVAASSPLTFARLSRSTLTAKIIAAASRGRTLLRSSSMVPRIFDRKRSRMTTASMRPCDVTRVVYDSTSRFLRMSV